MRLLSAELVDAIHDEVLNPGELAGRARDKSLEGALARVENRLAYGLVEDVFDVAAAYAVAISRSHCFQEGNMRTAHWVMDACLDLNGVEITWRAEDVGAMIVHCAQGFVEDGDLAEWLRERAAG
ncbi:type II toxin-antitoxin system death-on-curing family toxin [Silicimonas algicola]|uniref:Death-on-curing protein n=1 Tax=Silicimonas algicola TaxID=1826607 RepID=A0A316G3Q4_9RHOB|nr:type II toxin-antitoxin system death-on-curing family toxin [Silicimonas algicola]AZQ66794.1 type II toxin-antitoxin system death-on-curing family toxin [Silicimonas algicola]PWK55303.1 death-on-curing protein [Silicimonas algicola]